MKKRICAVMVIVMILGAFGVSGTTIMAEETDLEKFISDWGNPIRGDKGIEIYSEDFNSYEENTSFTEAAGLYDHWTPARGNGGDATHDGIFKKDGDNVYLSMQPFTQLVSNYRLATRYVFEVEYKSPNHQFGAIFIRTTGETFVKEKNLPYYESDDSNHGNAGLGSTGMYVIPRAKKLQLYIKTYDAAAKNWVGNEMVEFDVDVDFTAEPHKIAFADTGDAAYIYVDEKLVGSVSFSNEGDLEDMLSEYPSFRTAVIRDAAGTELKTVENARISSEFSCVALAMRINDMRIDNIRLVEFPEYVKPIESMSFKTQPSVTEFALNSTYSPSGIVLDVTYTDGTKDEVTVTSDMVSGFDSSALGSITLTVTYGDKTLEYNVTIVSPPTPSPAPTPTPVPTATPTPTQEPEESSGGMSTTTIILIAAGAAVVLIAVVVVIIIKKKK